MSFFLEFFFFKHFQVANHCQTVCDFLHFFINLVSIFSVNFSVYWRVSANASFRSEKCYIPSTLWFRLHSFMDNLHILFTVSYLFYLIFYPHEFSNEKFESRVCVWIALQPKPLQFKKVSMCVKFILLSFVLFTPNWKSKSRSMECAWKWSSNGIKSNCIAI